MDLTVRPVSLTAPFQVGPGETDPRPCHVELTAAGELSIRSTSDPSPAGHAIRRWPLPGPVPADVADDLLAELAPLARTVLAGWSTGDDLTEAAQRAAHQIQERCAHLECDVAQVDADGVIRALADPDDQTPLSAAEFARDWLMLDASTPDDQLPRIVEQADRVLREDMHLVSDQTPTAVHQLRDVLRVREAIGDVVLAAAGQDKALVTATVDRIGPITDLPPATVRDVVQEVIRRARAQAIADAVADVVRTHQEIAEAEAAHQTRMATLKATLQARIETAISAGRPVGLLAGDLDLSRQRVDQIRRGTR